MFFSTPMSSLILWGEREGFFEDASAIFAMIEAGQIHATTSALTIVNSAYILKKRSVPTSC
jgi:hypothetical protein